MRAQAVTALSVHVQHKYNIRKGAIGMCAPLSVQFLFISVQFSAKSCNIILLSIQTQGSAPRPGNLGSATAEGREHNYRPLNLIKFTLELTKDSVTFSLRFAFAFTGRERPLSNGAHTEC